MKCDKCKGTGEIPDPCKHCNGSGIIVKRAGRGYSSKPCKHCLNFTQVKFEKYKVDCDVPMEFLNE